MADSICSCGISAKITEDKVGANLTPAEKALGYIERQYQNPRFENTKRYTREELFHHQMTQEILDEYGVTADDKNNILFTCQQADKADAEREAEEDLER